MDKEIKEYSLAIEENLEAQSQEIRSKVRVKKARHRLLMARDALRNRERDLLDNTLILN